MTRRLTDEEIAYAAHADTPHEMVFEHHKAMGVEIQERRAADLTPEQLDAIRWVRDVIDVNEWTQRETAVTAIEALGYILLAHGVTP